MKTAVRLCLALTVLVALMTPAGSARDLGARPATAPLSWMDLARWLLGTWTKAGGCIDPNGKACASAVPTSDHGGCIDPNGKACASAVPTSDHGICIDPDGRLCASAVPTSDARGCIDPNGTPCAEP